MHVPSSLRPLPSPPHIEGAGSGGQKANGRSPGRVLQPAGAIAHPERPNPLCTGGCRDKPTWAPRPLVSVVGGESAASAPQGPAATRRVPEVVAMHVGLLVSGLALFLVTRAAVVRLRTGHRGLSLHPAEVAYLVAGPEHALLVAGVDLHDAGLLHPVSRPEGARMTREQVLQLAPSGCAVDETATPELPLERAVVRALAAEPGRPVADKRLHTAPEMTELRAHLTRLGLIVDGRRAWLVRLSALWPIVVLSFGVIWLDAGIGGPEAWLSLLAAVAVTTAGIWFGVPRQTPAARRAIQQAAAHRHDVAERLMKRVATVGLARAGDHVRDATCVRRRIWESSPASCRPARPAPPHSPARQADNSTSTDPGPQPDVAANDDRPADRTRPLSTIR